MMKNILEWVKDILIAVVIAGVFFCFSSRLSYSALHGTDFQPGDYVITSRQAYTLFGEPERGDIIVFKSQLLDEEGNEKNLIKRIIALPGDTIEIKAGYTYVNGEKSTNRTLPSRAFRAKWMRLRFRKDNSSLWATTAASAKTAVRPRVGTVSEDSLVGKVVLRLYRSAKSRNSKQNGRLRSWRNFF